MKKFLSLTFVFLIGVTLVAGCATPTPEVQVVKETVKETVIVEGTPQVVEKEITKVVVVTSTPEPATDPRYGGTFIAGVTFGDPDTLNPIDCDSYTCGQVLGTIFSYLVRLGPGGQLQPDLAETWEFSGDGKELTFYIRENANWSDGQPVTAEDVIFTLEELQDPDAPYTRIHDLSIAGEPIQFEAVDAKTVKFIMADSYGPILSLMSDMWIMPKHLVNADDPLAGPFNQQPIGSGPFKFVEWKQGESLTVEANEGYYDSRPYLDKIVFRMIPSKEAAVPALQSGEIDAVEVRSSQLPQLQGDRNLVVIPDPDYDHAVQFRINTKSPILSNHLVRQALNIATDREEYIWGVWGGYAEPSNTMFSKAAFCWEASEPTLPEYDVEAAKALLEEAGWKDEDGDGIREAHGVEGLDDGTPFSFELITYSAARYGPLLPIAQAQWKKVGLDLKIRVLEPAAAGEIIDAYEHDMYAGGWGSFGREPQMYRGMWGKGNTYQYHNPKVNELWDAGAREVDEAKRKAIYDEMENIYAEELPIIPIAFDYTFLATRHRVVLDEAGLYTFGTVWTYYSEKLYVTQE